MIKKIILTLLLLIFLCSFVNATNDLNNGGFDQQGTGSVKLPYTVSYQKAIGCSLSADPYATTNVITGISQSSPNALNLDNGAAASYGLFTIKYFGDNNDYNPGGWVEDFNIGFYFKRYYGSANAMYFDGSDPCGLSGVSYILDNETEVEADLSGSCASSSTSFQYCRTLTGVPADTNYLLIKGVVSAGTDEKYSFDTLNYIFPDTNLSVSFDPTNIYKGDEFTVSANYYYAGGAVPHSSCDLIWDGTTYAMTFNETTDVWEKSLTDNGDSGTKDYNVNCTSSNFTDQNVESTKYLNPSVSACVTLTPIDNSHGSVLNSGITLAPNDYDKDLSFKLVNSCSSITTPISLTNINLDGRQYFVYTSPDGSNWVLNDTLTFGSSFNNPIQKIYNSTNNYYDYNFTDVLISTETKYYRLTFRNPMKYWETIYNSTDWFKQLAPVSNNLNGKTYDVYNVSDFSDVYNKLIEELAYLHNDDSENVNYELQFTGYADTPLTIMVGQEDYLGNKTTTTHVIGVNPTRYSFSLEDVNSRAIFLTDANTGNTLYLTDYAIVQRGLFTNRLKFLTGDYETLAAMLINGVSEQYLQELVPFRADTEIYDRSGTISEIRIEVFLDGAYSDSNRVWKYIITEDNPIKETRYNLKNTLLQGIVDLNGTAQTDPLRTVGIRVIATDENKTSYQQEGWVKLIQFPYTNQDIVFNLIQNSFKVGQSPEGTVYINSRALNSILGIKIAIWEKDVGKSRTNPDYVDTWYRDTDFSCSAFECSFNWKINDWVFEDQNNYVMSALLLINTENENYDNHLTYREATFPVYYKSFDTARILETYERTDHTYKNSEKIPIVVQLRTDDKSSAIDQLNISAKLKVCDNVGDNCELQTTEYYPDYAAYDDETGANYFFFNRIWLTDSSTLIPDGNKFSFLATIEDIKEQHETTLYPLLVNKCQTNDTVNFIANALGSILLDYNTATTQIQVCEAYSPAIVTTVTNSAYEDLLTINNSAILTSPNIECSFCSKMNELGSYSTGFEQDILCGTFYSFGDLQPDSFDVYITNENSDLSQDEKLGQYVKVTIPYSLISMNDIALMRNALASEYQSGGITTMQDLVFYGFNKISSNLYSIADYYSAETMASSLLNYNSGFDCNLQHPLESDYLTGAIFYKVKGINANNKYYLEKRYSELEPISSKKVNYWLEYKGLQVPTQGLDVEFYINSMQKINLDQLNEGKNNYLIINESPSVNVASGTADVNNTRKLARLYFDVISQVNYNYGQGSVRRTVPLAFSAVITEGGTFFSINGLFETIDVFLADPVGFLSLAFYNTLIPNALSVTAIFMVLIVIVWLYATYKKGKGQGE